MRRWTPDEPMSQWPDEDLRQVIDLMRTTYLEYCRAGLHPEMDGDEAAASALRRACRELGVSWMSWQADRVMAGLFNLFYLHSAGMRVSPVRFVERATRADEQYAGPELCSLAQFRASRGWTPIFCDHINPSYH